MPTCFLYIQAGYNKIPSTIYHAIYYIRGLQTYGGVGVVKKVKGERSMRKVNVKGEKVEGCGGVWAYLQKLAKILPGFGNRYRNLTKRICLVRWF